MAEQVVVTPDGARYLAMTEQRVARPFHLRWLQPRLCGRDLTNWTRLTRAALVAVACLTALYSGSPWMLAVGLLPGLAFAWRRPVLVDPLGMALALGSALTLRSCWPASIALACLAGMTRETAPVWAAVYAFNPLPLLGLVPVAARALMRQGGDVLDAENGWILAHPLKAAQKYHAGLWLDWRTMVAPWGGLLVALAGLNLRLGLALALGYAQLLVATDSVRLYQWAAPAMALAAVHVTPGWALPFVALAIVFNPWKGSGV